MRGFMVDADVETERARNVSALFRASGDSDNARARDLGELPDHAADRAGRRGHDDRFAWLGAMILFRPYQAVTPGMPTTPR